MISVFLTNTSFHQYFSPTQSSSLLASSCISSSVRIYSLLFLSPCYNDMWDTWKVNLCIIFLLFMAKAAVRPNINKVHEKVKDMKNTYLLLLVVTFNFCETLTCELANLNFVKCSTIERVGICPLVIDLYCLSFLLLVYSCLDHWHGSKLIFVFLSAFLDSLVKSVDTSVHQLLTGRLILSTVRFAVHFF